MKNIVMASNPYRDKNFETARKAQKILRTAVVVSTQSFAWPLRRRRILSCPAGLQLASLPEELPGAELLLCFGGDGTILHAAKAAAEAGIPALGINIGTMGFMAELESNEMHTAAQAARRPLYDGGADDAPGRGHPGRQGLSGRSWR